MTALIDAIRRTDPALLSVVMAWEVAERSVF